MISGGMFSADSPTAVRGADKIMPIDVYIPGCPPRPEAIIDAIVKLRKKSQMNPCKSGVRFRKCTDITPFPIK